LKGTAVEKELRRALVDEVPINYEFYYPVDGRWYNTQGFPMWPGAILIFRDIADQKTNSSQP
jgi:hypothetical protein